MKKFAAIIAAAALVLTGCAATTPIATQAWVMKQIAAFSVRPDDATVKTNSTGTVTFYSKAFIEGLPQCTAVSFTVRSVRRGFRTTWNAPAPTFLDLVFPKAWAAYPDHVTGTITIHVESGAWYETDAAGNKFAHPFNLGDGMDLTAEIDLPDMPDRRHTCNIGDDCNCEGAGKTPDDVDYPEDLETWTEEKMLEEKGSWEKWIDKDNPPEDVVVKDRRGEKKYYLTDLDGILLNLDNLEKSAAWIKAIASAMIEINDYINQAREAYAAAFICPKENPQHDFSEWVKTGADPNVIHYERECARCGKVDHKDDPCVHVWGKWNEIGRGEGVVTYMAICTICTANKTKAEPEPPHSACDLEKDEHYPATGDECGCLCGKYGKNGLASVDRSLHKWADTVNGDGIQVCVCKCGQFHLRREPTSYILNARRACAAICAYCKEKSGSGIGVGKAEDAEHTPCKVQDARCGCLCGTLTANNTDLEQFHIQKPGTCRCFGSDGNGGAWHFPCARSDCRNICQYLVDGKQHAASTKKERTALTVADASLHTKTKGARCGCECGTYSGSNHAQWGGVNFHNTQPYDCGCYCKHGSETQVPNYHKRLLDTDCDCACGSTLISHVAPNPPQCRCQGKCHNPRHFPVVYDGKCPGVCHGVCQESRDPSLKAKHAPEGSTRCGCQCNEISVTEFDSMSFHIPRGSPSCWCAGHHYHTHEPKDGCYNLCAFCNKVPGADRKSTRNADIDDHTFDAQKCVCECGEEHRSHSYKRASSTKVGEHVCAFCGNTIAEYLDLYRCKRCGDEKDGNHEEGHDSLCGRDPGADDDANMGYCEKHDLWYQGDKCPECDNETSGGGGEQGGNSSNQSGDPDSIL